jgi:hypothetical protein
MRRDLAAAGLLAVGGMLCSFTAAFGEDKPQSGHQQKVHDKNLVVLKDSEVMKALEGFFQSRPADQAAHGPRAKRRKAVLTKELLAILQETRSPDVFLLTVGCLEQMGTDPAVAIPAILRNAERLGILKDRLGLTSEAASEQGWEEKSPTLDNFKEVLEGFLEEAGWSVTPDGARARRTPDGPPAEQLPPPGIPPLPSAPGGLVPPPPPPSGEFPPPPPPCGLGIRLPEGGTRSVPVDVPPSPGSPGGPPGQPDQPSAEQITPPRFLYDSRINTASFSFRIFPNLLPATKRTPGAVGGVLQQMPSPH